MVLLFSLLDAGFVLKRLSQVETLMLSSLLSVLPALLSRVFLGLIPVEAKKETGLGR